MSDPVDFNRGESAARNTTERPGEREDRQRAQSRGASTDIGSRETPSTAGYRETRKRERPNRRTYRD